MFLRRFLGLAVASTFFMSGSAVCPAYSTVQPAFDAAGKEAVEVLSGYLKVDTTNPPGNEKAGAVYLAEILRKNGFEPFVFETTKSRAGVYARLKGTGAKRPIILLNHIDVVPALASDWKYPPFGGEVHEAEIWGRGAFDMKGVAVAQLEALILLKRSGLKLDRDIIFLATPDEEVGGDFGANWFVRNHPELIEGAEFLFNEGYFIDTTTDGKSRNWGIAISEKSALWLKVTAKADAGHGSMPLSASAPNKLVKALARLTEAPPKLTILPAVREYFKQISQKETGQLKAAYEDLDRAAADPHKVRLLLADQLKAPMIRNTVSLTVLKAGYKTNVIPAEAYAELDCRLLPGVKHEEFIADLKRILNDDSLDISVLEWVHADASPYDTECFEAVKRVAARVEPGVPVVPVVVPWFTDSHWFRDAGIVSYGFAPFHVDSIHLATMHGKDERIPVKELHFGVRLMYEILQELCSSKR